MTSTDFDLPPVACAPMAGGPSTVALASAVCEAGGLGFLAAGYASAKSVAEQIDELRAVTDRPFGVNLFAVEASEVDLEALDRYVESLADDAHRFGVEVGEPRFDDDGFEDKLSVLLDARVAVASFTFGCPDREVVQALQEVGTRVWLTVTTPDDARLALLTGCDALVAQGREAGGHRGSFTDDDGVGALSTLELVRQLAPETKQPVVAAGGIMRASDAKAAFYAGAAAVQAGTAFLLTPEAGTNALHRSIVGTDAPTAFTRAFTGRTARGIENEFMRRRTDAPHAYPHVHHATSPMRTAARAQGDADFVSMWAGVGHRHARQVPAADVVRDLTRGAGAPFPRTA